MSTYSYYNPEAPTCQVRPEIRRATHPARLVRSKRTEIDLWPVVEKASGQIIGHCGLIDKEVDGQAEFELVYVFAPSVWGKGYATEAASAVKNYAFEELGLERIVSLVDPRNAASERVAIKIGMQFEKETLRPSRKTLRVYALHASDD